ncbi:MAG: hypothetical protein ACRC33_09310 [Gemmataceae bacterium]
MRAILLTFAACLLAGCGSGATDSNPKISSGVEDPRLKVEAVGAQPKPTSTRVKPGADPK